MRKQKSYRSFLAMLAPIIGLLALGYAFRKRQPAKFVTAAHFAIVADANITRVYHVNPLPVRFEGGEDNEWLRVDWLIGYRGPKPRWWGEPLNIHLRNLSLLKKNGRQEGILYGGGGVLYDERQQSYTYTSTMSVPKQLIEAQFLDKFNASLTLETQSLPTKQRGSINVSKRIEFSELKNNTHRS